MNNPDFAAPDGGRRSFIKKSAVGAFVLAGGGIKSVTDHEVVVIS